MSKITKLARNTVQALTPYLSARRIGGKGHIWLNANEAPNCITEFQLNSEGLNRYPEFQPPELIQAYADYAHVETSQLLATRGADESIELLIRTFCESNSDKAQQECILICPPTYGMYAISAETADVGIVEVALDIDFNVDYQAVKETVLSNKKIKLVFLCAPNNPTGNLLDKNKLIKLLQATHDHALIVVDEAYIEFCPEASQVDLLSAHSNLVITRTLSKAFALAGIRCGFTIANSDVIEMLSKVIPPYPMPAPIAQIATQALSKTVITFTVEAIADFLLSPSL
jgi:histidinol-phosphate aminotransferase